MQALGEGQELPPELITALFEALSYDALLEGEALMVLHGAMPAAGLWGWRRASLHRNFGCLRCVCSRVRCVYLLRRPLANSHVADAEVADGLAAALCTLSSRYDLALAEPGGARYPGAYRLLAHPSADARRLVSLGFVLTGAYVGALERLADQQHGQHGAGLA